MSPQAIQFSNQLPFPPAPDETHLWLIDTSRIDDTQLSELASLLTDLETKRNGHYKREARKRLDLICRGILRLILSRYTDRTPEELSFETEEHGKPFLTGEASLHFNLSHSGDRIALAISPKHRIGVDIEQTQRKSDVLKIADQYFSSSEIIQLFEFPESEQRERFFDYWTLKEAYMKARGEGLSLGLDNFSFELKRGTAPAIRFNEALDDQPSRWRFYSSSWGDYRLALALQYPPPFPTLSVFDAIEHLDYFWPPSTGT